MAIWDWDIGTRWNPWREMDRMRRRMNQLVRQTAGGVLSGPFPPVNVWSNDEKAVATVEVPGVATEDLDISVENDVLTISGARDPEQTAEGVRYRRHERGHGAFSRNIPLPFSVEPDEVEASYENGILTITLPRAEVSKPRKIEITG